MMKNEKKQMIRYVACACFIIRAVINIPSIVTLFSVMDVAKSKNSTFGIILAAFLISLEIIGEVLVTVSIALSIPNMAIVGSVMSFASLLIRGVRCKFTIFGATDVEFWTSGLFWIVFWGVMSLSMLLGLNKKNTRKLCFAAGFLELIHFGVILPEQGEVLGILTSAARNYLDYGGLFIFDLNTEYKYKEILGEQTIAENREESSFIWENYYDEDSHINEYNLTLFIKEHGDHYRKYEETHYQKSYSLDTIRKLAEMSGLELLHIYDAFTHEEPKVDSERVYVVLRRPGQPE